ncbi:MAG: hemerythrin domain-containing protein [Aigarchaeota archaeon]|nr:hemerythrin domain-containing protein [Candidatus Pelearchaeum maunauluense]
MRILNALEERINFWKNSPRAIEVSFIVRVLEFSSVYVDRYHHGKEEGCLLPCFETRGMRRAGGPIEVILREHEAGRALIRQIESTIREYEEGRVDAHKVLELCREYIELLR